MELHKSIFLLFTVMISSDAVEVKKNLAGTEGGSITLPDPVEELGFLSFERKNLAMVNERKFKMVEKDYKDKVLWDTNTGLFTITGLQRNDSGIYTVDSKEGRVFTTSYKLTVYESVPAPAVNNVSVSAESCTLLCSVEKAGELLTLLWYKDEEKVIQNSSALSLPLTVHKQDFSSSYRCVAANPAEQKTVTVNVKTSCGENNNKDNDNDNDSDRQYSVNSEQEVQYTEINRVGYRSSQGGHLPDSSGPVDRSNLTTVYDKLEAHRMVDSDTADHVYDRTYPHI
ncbi:CD48 antigen BCM1 surface antigen BLAST-1 HM48-1 MRC OX-45 surface antigen SLAM family member 2 [Collichthys lucidus]|uniref:CD48 antigen BCM1 surface antigen BLAST-1 HM48-1 MRC OX-45 surface antigen SLAM family member 2 n=1 Tax=Collichthys lucidus TaxID=240159 RepID=A0A4U5U553_COLLU|nr:CD48 antigen BCM1 surface antigen BLAST-1 HM48-1 MRC OX-45 surface antigen SLAM family member 2 [Collichthys lucidus]